MCLDALAKLLLVIRTKVGRVERGDRITTLENHLENLVARQRHADVLLEQLARDRILGLGVEQVHADKCRHRPPRALRHEHRDREPGVVARAADEVDLDHLARRDAVPVGHRHVEPHALGLGRTPAVDVGLEQRQ